MSFADPYPSHSAARRPSNMMVIHQFAIRRLLRAAAVLAFGVILASFGTVVRAEDKSAAADKAARRCLTSSASRGSRCQDR